MLHRGMTVMKAVTEDIALSRGFDKRPRSRFHKMYRVIWEFVTDNK